MQSLSRMAFCASLLMVTVALCTGTAGAQANPQEPIRIDIPAQPLVDRAQPFPPMPKELARSRLELIVPVEFELP